MPEYDGEIRIKASIDAKNADKEIQKLSSKFEKQSEALNRQSMAVENLKQKYEDLLNGIKKTPEESGIIKMINETKTAVNSLSKEISSKPFRLEPQIYQDKQKAEFKALQNDLKWLEKEQAKIKLNPESTKSMELLAKQIENATVKEQRLNSEMRQTESELAKLGHQKMGNFSKKINEASQAVRKMGTDSEETGKKSKGIFQNLGEAVSGFGSRIMRLAGAAFIFNIISAGFKKIREHMGNLIAQDNQLTS